MCLGDDLEVALWNVPYVGSSFDATASYFLCGIFSTGSFGQRYTQMLNCIRDDDLTGLLYLPQFVGECIWSMAAVDVAFPSFESCEIEGIC